MKKFISLVIACMLLLTLSVSAFAEHYDGTGNAVYDGNRINTDFGTEFKRLAEDFQPGDDLTIVITLSNDCDVATDWYMSNEVLKPFEDGLAADNGAYSYSLRYGDKVIFDSSVIGGEEGEGIQTSTGALNEFFFLDTIGAHQKGYVTLDFAIDGETQNNDYWNTLSQLELRFAVEKKSNGVTYIVPKTSDPMDIVLWGGTTLFCLFLVIIILKVDSRKRKVK